MMIVYGYIFRRTPSDGVSRNFPIPQRQSLFWKPNERKRNCVSKWRCLIGRGRNPRRTIDVDEDTLLGWKETTIRCFYDDSELDEPTSIQWQLRRRRRRRMRRDRYWHGKQSLINSYLSLSKTPLPNDIVGTHITGMRTATFLFDVFNKF